MGDGTQRLEDIFNNITAGTTGPSFAEETFWVSQHQQCHQKQPPHLSNTHLAQNCPFNPVPPNQNNPPPPPNTTLMSKEQADFEAVQFALKQAKMGLSSVLSITSTIKKEQFLQPGGSNFSQWTRLLQEIGMTHLTDKDFFFKPCDNLSFE
jgi:hypothetical protein